MSTRSASTCCATATTTACSSTRKSSRARRARRTGSTGKPGKASRRVRSVPLAARARKEGYVKGTSAPYHGYLYKILTAQGKDAKGGAYDYIVDGKMIGGFALVAYPARWGASGVMTFVCNHDGIVYEKNLGRDTGTIAASMTVYNPDASWKKPSHP